MTQVPSQVFLPQPYMAAMSQLRQAIMDTHHTIIPAGPIVEAGRQVHQALQPDQISGLSSSLLREIHGMVRALEEIASERGDEQITRQVALVFYTSLIEKGLPGAKGGKETIAEALRRLIQQQPQDPTEQMRIGTQSYYDRRTRRGLGLDEMMCVSGMAVPAHDDAQAPESNDDRIQARPTDSDQHKTIRRGVDVDEAVEAQDVPPSPPVAVRAPTLTAHIPMVNKKGYLLIQGDIYDEATGETRPGPIESPYKLTDQPIGRGGYSKVYLAHEKGTNRRLAVKIVSSENRKLSQALFQGYQRELDLQPDLNSDRFVHVYAAGVTSQGDPFMVMELMEGGSLGELLGAVFSGRKTLELSQMISLATEVVAAAAEVHKRKLVHRDIKPDNYLLKEDGKNVKLADFQLTERASKLPPDPPPDIFGTVGYIPVPEEPDNYQRDVFALGVTLFEIFTRGNFPYEGYSPIQIMASMQGADVMEKIRKTLESRRVPASLMQVILTALAAPAQRYQDAERMLFDLVTHKARELEEEAREAQRQSTFDELSRKRHLKEWRQKLREALSEYRRVYDDYRIPEILDKMTALNYQLNRDAHDRGDDEEVRYTQNRIVGLSPDSREAREVGEKVHVTFWVDGRVPGVRPTFEIVKHENIDGVFEEDAVFQGEAGKGVPNTIGLERGSWYKAVIGGPGIYPVALPLPVRPGEYPMRLPIYALEQVPERGVVVPAGYVAARTRDGSYSERHTLWREQNEDVAFLPLVTTGEFFYYLMELAQTDPDLARESVPSNWGFDPFRPEVLGRADLNYKSGHPFEWWAPVTHIKRSQALSYLDFLSGRLGFPFRLPKNNEWKRLGRGNDAREWPWGDARPNVGMAAFRFRDPQGSGPVVPMPVNAHGIRDKSPFSIPNDPSRTILHVAGNVEKMLHIGEEERPRIAKALGLPEEDVGTRYFISSGAACDICPDNVDILNKFEADDVGLRGIFPVTPLRKARPTPPIDTLSS